MTKNNLLKKFLSFSIGSYIAVFIGLITVPITTRMLSPKQYGIFSMINTMVEMLMVICSLGMEQGFIRYFYDVESKNRGKLFYNTIYYSFFSSSCVFFMVFLLRKKLSIFILGELNSSIWVIIILMIVVTFLKLFSLLIIRMQQKAKLFSILNVLVKILEFLFILFFYTVYGDSYKTLFFSVFFSVLIISIISIIYEKDIWLLKGENIKISKKEIFNYSFPLAISVVLAYIFVSLDKITIRYFSNLDEIGLYAGAFRIISLIIVLQNAFTSFWTPVTYEHYSKYPEDLAFFKKINDYLAPLFFSLGNFVLLSNNFLILLLGKKFYSALYIMPMLVFIPIMYVLSETTMMGINFKKKTKYSLYISLIVLIVNLIGNLILVPILGARGAAISTGISYIIFFSLRTYFSTKLMNFGFNLKKQYFVVFLMLFYALFLTFYNYMVVTVIIGVILEIIIIIIYYPILNEIYKKYKRKL